MALPMEIFCCYAREDRSFLNKLKMHLMQLQREGLISIWNDADISPGANYEEEIDRYLNTADIILLLVSADFMASGYCYSVEMKRAMERHERGEAYVIPIILRPIYWQLAPFGKLQALPRDGKSIASSDWHSADEALFDVAEGIRETLKELASRGSIEFSIQQGDITTFNADVLALKYAQAFFGTDEIVAHLLSRVRIAENSMRPRVGAYRYVETQKCIQARHVLFVGVPDIADFNYRDIQEFAAKVLNILDNVAPATRHLAMTIHGAGFGLDEIEAFLAQITGYLQALQSKQFPANLEKITIIDIDSERVQRLRQAFEENFAHAGFVSKARNRWNYRLETRELKGTSNSNQQSTLVTEKVGIESEAKPHVFVAMPFKKDMDDVFYYGIFQPVRASGFICERIDQEAFIGDILDQVKKKIETAAVVIAELSGANPNVYLEVGYAWGKGRPTILLMKDEQELRFDVRGQRCLKYERIRDLEESLQKELSELKSKGFI
jgi:hypothetical protein